MTIQTARDFLADNNLAIRGARGKLSNAAKAELAKALAKGIKFSDWNELGKIKVEPVGKPRKAKVEGAPKVVAGKTEDGLWDISAPEHEPTELMVRLGKIQRGEIVPNVPFVREENAIKSTDKSGTVIVQDMCREGHAVRRCTCKAPQPSDYVNAVSFELVKV